MSATKSISINCHNCGYAHEITADHCHTAQDADNCPQWEASLPCGDLHALSDSQERTLDLMGAMEASEAGL